MSIEEKDQYDAINGVVLMQGLACYLCQPAAKEMFTEDEELRSCLTNALDECILAVRRINKQERRTDLGRHEGVADPAGLASR